MAEEEQASTLSKKQLQAAITTTSTTDCGKRGGLAYARVKVYNSPLFGDLLEPDDNKGRNNRGGLSTTSPDMSPITPTAVSQASTSYYRFGVVSVFN